MQRSSRDMSRKQHTYIHVRRRDRCSRNSHVQSQSSQDRHDKRAGQDPDSECERVKRPPYYPMLLYIYFVAGSEQLSSESNAIRLMAWCAYVGRETVQSSPKHLLHFSDRATSRLKTQISSQRVMYLISSSLVCWFVSKVPPEKIESIPISYTA
jgi:hypothetical protein